MDVEKHESMFCVIYCCICNLCYKFTLTRMEAKFFRFLKIVGVGYKARAEAEGRLLYLKLGYVHDVELTVPPAVRVFCLKNNVVCCCGLDKHRVHQFAASVRSCKPPEPFKGKGIMYTDEVIKKKVGKKKSK
ncbi:Ribosomal L6 domain-containing protein [Citrus sinensis]|nr:Ribosomal L6 domain-containing protein [Citrus sinensis]